MAQGSQSSLGYGYRAVGQQGRLAYAFSPPRIRACQQKEATRKLAGGFGLEGKQKEEE